MEGWPNHHLPFLHQTPGRLEQQLDGRRDAGATLFLGQTHGSARSGHNSNGSSSSYKQRAAGLTAVSTHQPTLCLSEHQKEKTRLKWIPQLHERFVQVIQQLGGPDKATPKSIQRRMNVEELTIPQIKSHLQKYRTIIQIDQANGQKENISSNSASLPDQFVHQKGNPSGPNIQQIHSSECDADMQLQMNMGEVSTHNPNSAATPNMCIRGDNIQYPSQMGQQNQVSLMPLGLNLSSYSHAQIQTLSLAHHLFMDENQNISLEFSPFNSPLQDNRWQVPHLFDPTPPNFTQPRLSQTDPQISFSVHSSNTTMPRNQYMHDFVQGNVMPPNNAGQLLNFSMPQEGNHTYSSKDYPISMWN